MSDVEIGDGVFSTVARKIMGVDQIVDIGGNSHSADLVDDVIHNSQIVVSRRVARSRRISVNMDAAATFTSDLAVDVMNIICLLYTSPSPRD